MFKGLGDLGKMGGMMKQAMALKDNIDSFKEQLGEERVEGSAGGGMVHVVVSGKMELLDIKIDPEVIDKDDPEMLETLVRAAVNEAMDKTRELVKEKMSEMTGGLDIPGLT